MKFFLSCAICLLIAGCVSDKSVQNFDVDAFEQELVELQTSFHIPGLAVLVKQGERTVYENYLGYADLDSRVPLDSSTLIPIASVSKTFASVLIFQLIEEGKLSLDTPINAFLDASQLSDSIKVKHVLSQTSQGEIGKHFLYSNRFSLLTRAIETAGGMSIEEQFERRIITPLALGHTVPFTGDSLVSKYTFAKPYTFYGSTEPGRYDPGVSAASGLASTVRDLARFDNALSDNVLISEESKTTLTKAFGSTNLYGYGVFVQQFLGEKMIWSYGQNDCFSSLFLKIPGKDLTLILLANNNLMSDPPRLINGDITYSLFALNFLKHFVYDLPEVLTFSEYKREGLENVDRVSAAYQDQQVGAFYRQELLGHAIANGYLGQADPTLTDQSFRLLRKAFEYYPDYTSYGNSTLLQNLMVLSLSSEIEELGDVYEKLGQELLEDWEQDPYVNTYLGMYYSKLGAVSDALPHFHTVADSDGFSPFWYTLEAWNYLATYYKDEKPSVAKAYYQRIIDTGWNYAGYLENARATISTMH